MCYQEIPYKDREKILHPFAGTAEIHMSYMRQTDSQIESNHHLVRAVFEQLYSAGNNVINKEQARNNTNNKQYRYAAHTLNNFKRADVVQGNKHARYDKRHNDESPNCLKSDAVDVMNL